MGQLGIDAMIDVTDPDTALVWHLESNHYPPIDLRFLPVAKAAIAAANEGDWDKVIDFPEGAQKESDTAHAICDALHLSSFITYDEEF